MKVFYFNMLVIGLVGCKSNAPVKSPEFQGVFFPTAASGINPLLKMQKLTPAPAIG